jgi:hypothetical protein
MLKSWRSWRVRDPGALWQVAVGCPGSHPAAARIRQQRNDAGPGGPASIAYKLGSIIQRSRSIARQSLTESLSAACSRLLVKGRLAPQRGPSRRAVRVAFVSQQILDRRAPCRAGAARAWYSYAPEPRRCASPASGHLPQGFPAKVLGKIRLSNLLV